MERREIVRRAIEFRSPPRLPFWQEELPAYPNDVFCTREMDRGKGGWFFDNAVTDDWGCRWEITDKRNMGQAVGHPLQDWSALSGYRPPDPRAPFYFERLGREFDRAEDRYTAVTCHFNLFERLYMLHGFSETLEDLYLEPDRIERVLEMICEFKIQMLNELHRRFGDRVDGIFLTDDWGTQEATFISPEIFDRFFLERYRRLADAIHACGWHMILHSCGKVNAFLPRFIEAGIDMMNMMQPRCYGIAEVGRIAAGKIAFLTSVDIQATLPQGDTEAIREEAELLLRHWRTDRGGVVAFCSGEAEVIGADPDRAYRAMLDAFAGQGEHAAGE